MHQPPRNGEDKSNGIGDRVKADMAARSELIKKHRRPTLDDLIAENAGREGDQSELGPLEGINPKRTSLG